MQQHAVRVDDVLPEDDAVWQDSDVTPSAPLRVTGRLSSAGSGRFYLSGHLSGHTVASCRRCLTETAVQIEEDVHLVFAEATGESGEESDVYVLPPRAQVIDLRPAVREEWLLAAPAYVLCREDCRGLCPRCGADLNVAPCRCAPEPDARWDALRAAVRDRASS
ncbi:MAG TPA: DUF177 domain-containing protein [Gemmatimonadaceae bacterium]|nr:DUF177 domain-containing protein [Gemmatimonadaceae bacterium]